MTGVVFRKDGPWGAGKGAPIDEDDYDYTLWALLQQIQAKATQGVGISNIIVFGSEMHVVLTDHTILGPYELPTVRFTFKNAWTASTQYYTNDIFTANGSTYMVLVSHISALTFDAGANDGHGNSYYGLLLSNPSLALPTGGAVGMVLTKTTSSDFATGWVSPLFTNLHDVLPSPGPAAGELVYFNGSYFSYIRQSDIAGATQALLELSDVLPSPAPTDGEAVVWNASSGKFTFGHIGGSGTLAGLSDLNIGSQNHGDVLSYNSATTFWEADPPNPTDNWSTSTKTIALSDINTFFQGAGSSQTLTIPSTVSMPPVSFPKGFTIFLKQVSVGQPPIVITLDGGSFNLPQGRVAKPRATGSVVRLTHQGFDTWDISGDLVYEVARGSSEIFDPGSGNIEFDMRNFDADVYPYTPARSVTFDADMFTSLAGRRLTFVFTTSGTSSYTMTFGTGFKSQGTLATGTVSGKVFAVHFVCDGTNLVEISRTTAM